MQSQATLFQLGTDLKKAPTRNAKAPQSRQAQAEGFDNTGVGPIMGSDTDNALKRSQTVSGETRVSRIF